MKLINPTLPLFQKRGFEYFPQQLLYRIALYPGQHVRQLSLWMQKWLPVAPTYEVVQQAVTACLEWFLDHGDIQREFGASYRCMPAYVIGASSLNQPKLVIYGDPRIDQELKRRSFSLVQRLIYQHTHSPYPCGYERRVIGLDSANHQLIKQTLPWLELATLTQALPSIAELEVPDPQKARALTVEGVFEIYDPQFAQQPFYQAWRLKEQTNRRLNCLVRWRPTVDSPAYLTRYYYQHYPDALSALEYDYAVLWRWKIDAQTFPRQARWVEKLAHLQIPKGLPAQYWQWLQFLITEQPSADGDYWRLKLPLELCDEVRDVLTTRLGIQWRTTINQA